MQKDSNSRGIVDEVGDQPLVSRYTPAEFTTCSDRLDLAFEAWYDCDPVKDSAVKAERKGTLWIEATRFSYATPACLKAKRSNDIEAFHDAVNDILFDVLEGRSPYRRESGPFSHHFQITLSFRTMDRLESNRRGLAPDQGMGSKMRWILKAAETIGVEPERSHAEALTEEVESMGHPMSVAEVRRTLDRYQVVRVIGDGNGGDMSEDKTSIIAETISDHTPDPSQILLDRTAIDEFSQEMTRRIEVDTKGQTRIILIRMLAVHLDKATRTGSFGSLEKEGHREVQSRDLAEEFDVSAAYISKLTRKFRELAIEIWKEEGVDS